MNKQLAQILEGTGIGLVAGFVIGYTGSEWIRLILVFALFAFAGGSIKGFLQIDSNSQRSTLMGIATFVAILIGLFAKGYHVFDEAPAKAVARWELAGYSPVQARAMVLKQWEAEQFKEPIPSGEMSSIFRSLFTTGKQEQPSESQVAEPAQDTGDMGSPADNLPQDSIPAEGDMGN